MIYLDHGATSFYKPPQVRQAMLRALKTCASPGRGGYRQSIEAARLVYRCRETAADFFDCEPEQVVFTSNCTHGLNIAIQTLVNSGDRVVISGFEHNAVLRPLHAKNARITVVGRRLFHWESLLTEFRSALQEGADLAIFTHVSNVFGYELPIYEMAKLCKMYAVPFIIDAAQSAGTLRISLKELGADFIAMPGHKGLLGPQGTGILLCNTVAKPLFYGGTGSDSRSPVMPELLPDRLEAGTMNVPGIAGLAAGINFVKKVGLENIQHHKQKEIAYCVKRLKELEVEVFSGHRQCGTVSFVPPMDCEEVSDALAKTDIAVRAGLHCAPLAHESAGTLNSGTVRVSFGPESSRAETDIFIYKLSSILKKI